MTPSPMPLPEKFELFVMSVRDAIGAHNRTLPGWMCLWMWARIRRIGTRVGKLLGKLRAGIYRPSRPRARNPEAARQPPYNPVPNNIRSTVPAGARLPTGFGWMKRILPFNYQRYSGNACNSALDALLQDPEMQAHIRTCPSLARQLRPLCHMLGLKLPDFLKLPPRPPASTPRAPRQPRPVPPPPAPAPPPRPLPYAIVSSTVGPYPSPNLSICGLKNWPP